MLVKNIFLYSTFPLQFNFVGRIIGPRGLTLRQVEQETACKILVRGRGSMKDKKMVGFGMLFYLDFFSYSV